VEVRALSPARMEALSSSVKRARRLMAWISWVWRAV
jgi:hypothetical protein